MQRIMLNAFNLQGTQRVAVWPSQAGTVCVFEKAARLKEGSILNRFLFVNESKDGS